MGKTIIEPAREIRVLWAADVAVVGGGPAGLAAAVASARNGADTVLVERYGHLGGMATGGLVILIMPMSDADGRQQIAGICQEIVERLDAKGAAVHPVTAELGSADATRVDFWLSRGCRFFAQEGRVTLNVLFDPEILKCVLNDMVEEAGVKLLLHSWGSRALIEGDRVGGVVFESKSGRLAVTSRVLVDATGDGDMFASAGAEFDASLDPSIRSSTMALVFRVGNVDFEALRAFQRAEPGDFAHLMAEIEGLGGHTMFIRTWREDMVWFNSNLPGLDGLNSEDLTRVEVEGRKKMLITYDFFKKHVPGFAKSVLVDTASQVGVRGSRRLTGEYVITEKDVHTGTVHPDTIAIVPARQWAPRIGAPVIYVPYRALVPKKIENLLAAGRCLSSDQFANDLLSPIQSCVAMGEAAGTAASLAVAAAVTPRLLDTGLLRRRLAAQGAVVPA